jgi:hypothetical protein
MNDKAAILQPRHLAGVALSALLEQAIVNFNNYFTET